MPIRGHPSGRGSQALKTASLGRDGVGLEAPHSGIWELKDTSEFVSLYLGKRSCDTCPGHRRNQQNLTKPWSLLTGEATRIQGKGNGFHRHIQTNSFSGDSAHCQVWRPYRFPSMPDVRLGVQTGESTGRLLNSVQGNGETQG